MWKYFFKIFGIVMAIFAALGVLIAGIIFAASCHPIAGTVAFVLGIAIFVAALMTIVEYSTRWW